MKKKNILLIFASIHVLYGASVPEPVSRDTSALQVQFEFDEEENASQLPPQVPVLQEPRVVELAKDIAARVGQEILWLYVFLYEWSKKVLSPPHE